MFRPDYTSLGIADEVENNVSFLRLRETGLNLGATIGDIQTLEVNCVVDILDIADNFGRETSSTKANDIYTRKGDWIPAAKAIRRYIFVDLRAAADH